MRHSLHDGGEHRRAVRGADPGAPSRPPNPIDPGPQAAFGMPRPGAFTRYQVQGAAAVKALVKHKAEPGLWLMDVPEPETGPGDVLIKVLRTGICGTDLHIRDYDGWAQQAVRSPLVLGHEFVGEVAAIGADVVGRAFGLCTLAAALAVSFRRRHVSVEVGLAMAGVAVIVLGTIPFLRYFYEPLGAGDRDVPDGG